MIPFGNYVRGNSCENPVNAREIYVIRIWLWTTTRVVYIIELQWGYLTNLWSTTYVNFGFFPWYHSFNVEVKFGRFLLVLPIAKFNVFIFILLHFLKRFYFNKVADFILLFKRYEVVSSLIHIYLWIPET